MSYSAAHWHGVHVPGVILKMSETVYENERELISQSELLENYFQSVIEMSADLRGVYSKEMKRSGILRSLCALFCLVLSIISIFCKPRKLAFFVIPIALIGTLWLSVVM